MSDIATHSPQTRLGVDKGGGECGIRVEEVKFPLRIPQEN